MYENSHGDRLNGDVVETDENGFVYRDPLDPGRLRYYETRYGPLSQYQFNTAFKVAFTLAAAAIASIALLKPSSSTSSESVEQNGQQSPSTQSAPFDSVPSVSLEEADDAVPKIL